MSQHQIRQCTHHRHHAKLASISIFDKLTTYRLTPSLLPHPVGYPPGIGQMVVAHVPSFPSFVLAELIFASLPTPLPSFFAPPPTLTQIPRHTPNIKLRNTPQHRTTRYKTQPIRASLAALDRLQERYRRQAATYSPYERTTTNLRYPAARTPLDVARNQLARPITQKTRPVTPRPVSPRIT